MFAHRAIGNACRVLRQVSASTSSRYGTVKPITTSILAQRSILPSTVVPGFRRYSSTKTEATLADYLKEEIEVEKKLAKQHLASSHQPDIPGFQIKTDQREVVLSKQHGSEKITVSFDVNHTVDTDADEPQTDPGKPSPKEETQPPMMVSKPNFTVQVEKGDQKLVFECAFIEQDYGEGAEEADYGDPFNIEEIYIYSGEITEKNKIYATSGGIIDGTLYDHLMNYLEERGISGEFAENLSRYATFYEHSLYVSLLQKLRDFVSH